MCFINRHKISWILVKTELIFHTVQFFGVLLDSKLRWDGQTDIILYEIKLYHLSLNNLNKTVCYYLLCLCKFLSEIHYYIFELLQNVRTNFQDIWVKTGSHIIVCYNPESSQLIFSKLKIWTIYCHEFIFKNVLFLLK